MFYALISPPAISASVQGALLTLTLILTFSQRQLIRRIFWGGINNLSTHKKKNVG